MLTYTLSLSTAAHVVRPSVPRPRHRVADRHVLRSPPLRDLVEWRLVGEHDCEWTCGLRPSGYVTVFAGSELDDKLAALWRNGHAAEVDWPLHAPESGSYQFRGAVAAG